MKKVPIYILTFILVLTSCFNKKEQQSSSTIKKDNIVILDKSNEFLDLFPTINPNGLHIYPPSWDEKGNLNKTPFKGIPLDVKKYPYLDNEEIFLNIQACKEANSHIYAIGKFEINKDYYGLITRQRSQYDESLIQLLLWNRIKNKIEKGIDLADSFGDEGWYFDTESWIDEYKVNSNLKVLTRRKDSEFDEENQNKIYTDFLKTNIFKNGKFVETENELGDTVNYKLKEWK